MARFNKRTTAVVTTAPVSFIKTEATASGSTFEGGPGFARDAKSELFLLAVSTFLTGDNSFYESGKNQDTRFNQLVASVAVSDPQWIAKFLRWLRAEANIRTASIIGAVEAVRAMVRARIPGARSIVNSVMLRADEPGEALAYWLSQGGRQIPKPLKRGIADAAQRLYNEFNVLKYDSDSAAVKFPDVLELCHVRPGSVAQSHLFNYLVGKRFDKNLQPHEILTVLNKNRGIRALAAERPRILMDPDALKQAGMTWQAAQSLLGSLSPSPALKRELWESLVPTMGYMALLRNLRNFSENGVSTAVLNQVIQRLTDPDEVARSRQFPFRFLSAYLANTNSVTWASALETALQLSLQNIPTLPGRTLILVDVSGSMSNTLSKNSEMRRSQAAGLFGAALALRNHGNATLVKYDDSSSEIRVPRGASLLPLMNRFIPNGGTYTTRAVRQHFNRHDRVVIITDEQTAYDGDPGSAIPANVPLYTWNLGGYRLGHAAGRPLRYTFGGLTDQAWQLIPLLEAGQNQQWPFATTDGIVTPASGDED